MLADTFVIEFFPKAQSSIQKNILQKEEQNPLEKTCDYGPGSPARQSSAPARDHPKGASPPVKRLKFEDPSSPGPPLPPPAPGTASSSTDPAPGPTLPIAEPGTLLPIADGTTAEPSASSSPAAQESSCPAAQPEKKDEADENEGDKTTDYQVSFYTNLTADLLEHRELLQAGCGHDPQIFNEIKRQLNDLEELIQEGLDKFHYEPLHHQTYLNYEPGSAIESS